MFQGLRTVIYPAPRLAEATGHEAVRDVGEGILVGTVRDPLGNVLGIIQNPHF